jgi:hypothetical protein
LAIYDFQKGGLKGSLVLLHWRVAPDKRALDVLCSH